LIHKRNHICWKIFRQDHFFPGSYRGCPGFFALGFPLALTLVFFALLRPCLGFFSGFCLGAAPDFRPAPALTLSCYLYSYIFKVLLIISLVALTTVMLAS
jgi:hypothetical protein